MENLQKVMVLPAQQSLLNQCSSRLNGLVASVNAAIATEDSREKLIALGDRMKCSQFPNGLAFLKRGRIICAENEFKCTRLDKVGNEIDTDLSTIILNHFKSWNILTNRTSQKCTM